MLIILWCYRLADQYEEWCKHNSVRKMEKSLIQTRYRTQLICNNIIMTRTFPGENYSEIFDKVIEYSFEETNELPGILILRKDVIYL